jgi:hypothetical protein
MLELESGYRLESDDVAQLRHSVKTGMWDEAAALLRRLGVTMDNERVRLRPWLMCWATIEMQFRQHAFSLASRSIWNN